jgi:methylated-DNA-protein-cysteine methyltransferase-like protein
MLNAYSRAEELPWHRVVNKQGRISLKPGEGYELQKSLLVREGVRFDNDDNIDLDEFQWRPE